MKTLFIPTRKKLSLSKKILNSLNNLPSPLSIFYSIQFESQAKQVKESLANSKVNNFSQVLGCASPKVSKDTKAILLIGSGLFHAKSIAINSSCPVFILENNNIIQLKEKDIEDLKKLKKSAYMKFLTEDKIGILISTKPGQQRLSQAMKFAKSLNKKYYFFISNELSSLEFENFGIKSFVNSACPRMDMASNSVINIQDLIKLNFCD